MGESSAAFGGTAVIEGLDTITTQEGNSLASVDVQIVASSSTVVIDYVPACQATNHAVSLGSVDSFGLGGELEWTGAFCDLGTSGSATFDPGDPNPGELFYFAVVGQGASSEGSYGRSSDDLERPEATEVGICDLPQDLGANCRR